jgi:hypothetical protein
MSYKIEELNLKDNSNSEQTRTRKIFLDLKSKAIKGEKLTEHEKEFFCQSVRLSLLDDGLESDYPCCSNPIFKFKYLIYWHDLTGGTAYQKPERGKLVNISQVEAERDLKYLIQEAKNWLVEIEKTNHTLELMQQISKETRCQKKTLDNTPEFNNTVILKGSFYYLYKLWALLLMSKFVFLTCLEIIETLSKFPYQFEIGSNNIEFNEYSLIHIIMRHYAELTKKFQTGKSYHNLDFNPRQLTFDLEKIFKKIESVTPITPINNIIFELNNQLYEIWINIRNKSIKDTGVIQFYRIETFYPIEDTDRLKTISQSYSKFEIESNLNYYKNTAGNSKYR